MARWEIPHKRRKQSSLTVVIECLDKETIDESIFLSGLNILGSPQDFDTKDIKIYTKVNI